MSTNGSRFRPTVRLKLTLIYGGCFLAVGALLLAFNYALVRRSIDGGPPFQKTVRVLAPAFVAQGAVAIPGGLPAGGATFTMPVPVEQAVPVPAAKVFILPPEAGYGPVAGTIIDRPVTVDGQPVVDVIKEFSSKLRDHTLSELVSDSAMALGGMSILSVLLGWMVAGRVLRPLHNMTATARRLSDENLYERFALTGPDDELKELGDTFDAMLGRLESAFESQKRFVANASHELRTPLAVMRAEVDVTLADPDATPADLRAMAETVRGATERCDALIDGLLTLARSDRGPTATTTLDLATVVAEAAAQSAAEAKVAGVRLDLDLAPATIQGDVALLGRLAGNLIENAIRYNLPAGGWLRAVTELTGTRTAAGGQAVLVVENPGPDVPADAIEGLFEPFRRLVPDRTAPARARGAGLGLSIVRSVAVAHGGTVTAEPRSEGGLVVTVRLPATAVTLG